MPHVITDNSGQVLIDELGRSLVGNQFINVLLFNKDNDYVTIPHHSPIDFGAQDNFSISGWFLIVEPSVSSSRYQLFSKRSNTTPNIGYELILLQTNTTTYTLFFLITGAGVTSAISYVITGDIRGRWMHFVVVKTNSNPSTSVSPSEWKFYVNNVDVVKTAPNTGVTPSTNIKNTISARINAFDPTTLTATMYMGPISIYSKALSAAEVDFLFKSDGIVPKSAVSNLVWSAVIKESSGTTLNNTLGSDNGLLNNFANTTSGDPSNAWRNGFTLNAS